MEWGKNGGEDLANTITPTLVSQLVCLCFFFKYYAVLLTLEGLVKNNHLSFLQPCHGAPTVSKKESKLVSSTQVKLTLLGLVGLGLNIPQMQEYEN